MDLQKRTASVLNTSDPDFDGIFIQATALNPHLALLLDDEQLTYARNAIEQQVIVSFILLLISQHLHSMSDRMCMSIVSP